MLDYGEAAAVVAAALDDPKRSLIGDPREGVYKVSLVTTDMGEAMEYAQYLARLGVIPTTTIRHDDQFGKPVLAEVNVWSHPDQKRLFGIAEGSLAPPRRQELEDLVLARSPVPETLLRQIASARRKGATPTKIAERLNNAGIIEGMGGKCWTPKKVNAALQHQEQTQPAQAA